MTQDKSQEPVAWLLTDKNINSLQVDSIQRLIDRLKHAHHTDLCVRINGQDEWFQADWLKHMVRATPPQRTEQEREACERCKQLEEQAYDLVGELRVANIKLSMRPQRTWVGLTAEEVLQCWEKAHEPGNKEHINAIRMADEVEAKLKEKNCG